jgi:WD40 repeat protein
MIDADNARIVKTHRSHKYGLSQFTYLNGDRSGVMAVAVPSVNLPTRDYGIRVWDLDRNKFCRVFKGHEGAIESLTCHSTRDICLSTSSEDGLSQIWDTREDKPVWTNQSGANTATFDKTYNSLMFALSHAGNKSIQIFDLRSPDKPVHEFTRMSCCADELIMSGGTKLFFASHSTGTVVKFDINKNKEESMILASPIRGALGKRKFNISLSSCSKYISISNLNNNVDIWDFETRVKVKTLVGHGGQPVSAFSPSHTLVATASMPLALWVPQAEASAAPDTPDVRKSSIHI